MWFRDVLLEDDPSVGDSGTKTINIEVTDWLTELLIHFKVKNDTATVDDVPPENSITKIELVDGGRVYWSLTGPQAVAAACFDTGHWPEAWYDEAASANQRIKIPIRFGRYIGDPRYGYDPTKLVNPQLKVTWAKASTHLADSVQLGVYARVVEGLAAPSECLMWNEVEAFVGAASGDKKVEIPTDYPIRRLAVRAYSEGQAVETCISNLKLDCDVGKLIPFDMTTAQFKAFMRGRFPEYSFHKQDWVDHGDQRELWLAGNTHGFAECSAGKTIIRFWPGGAPRYVVWLYDDTGATLTERELDVRAFGLLPHNTMCYQFGVADESGTWFPAASFKSLYLYLTQGLADAANSVFVQQPRKLGV